MNKKDYINSRPVISFIEWINSILDVPNSFHHNYFLKRQKIDWKCDSIFSAFENYSWQFNYTNEFNTIIKGSSFNECEEVLHTISGKLKKGVVQRNNEVCKEASRQILEWGGVTNRNIDKIDNMGQKWCVYLSETKKQFESNLDSNEYYKSEIIMNSGFTKIYSLLVDNFLIYDGRLGAALGLLVRGFCEENKLETIPEELNFSWGAGRESNINNKQKSRRNPSSDKYIFKSLHSPKSHLENNIRANWLVQEILCNTKSKFGSLEESKRMRSLESALFMIGYHVRDYTFKMNNSDVL